MKRKEIVKYKSQKCGCERIYKVGFQCRKQGYKCKNCGYQQVYGDNRLKYSDEERRKSIILYLK